MNKLVVGCAVLAIGLGYLLFSPLKVKDTSLTVRTVFSAFAFAKRMSYWSEHLGLATHNVVFKKFESLLPTCGSDPNMKVTEEKIGGIRALLFRPTSESSGARPALVYFHGGGFTFCSPELYCNILKMLTKRLQVVVVAFDYRKAPQHPFPAAFDDCLAGLQAFVSMAPSLGVDVNRLVVAGDSAGGNLALSVVAHLHSSSDSQIRIAQLSLFYPTVQALDFKLPSYIENAQEPMLRSYDMFRFWQNYATGVSGEKWIKQMKSNSHASEVTRQRAKALLWDHLPAKAQRTPDGPVDEAASKALAAATSDVLASPILLADETLTKLPPVYLLTCEFDVLRDEGIALAKRLEKVRHPLTHRHAIYYHSLLTFAEFNEPESVKTVDHFVEYIQRNL